MCTQVALVLSDALQVELCAVPAWPIWLPTVQIVQAEHVLTLRGLVFARDDAAECEVKWHVLTKMALQHARCKLNMNIVSPIDPTSEPKAAI